MARRRKLTLRGVRDALWRTVEGVPRKHTLQMAAAMAYYFVLALFPAVLAGCHSKEPDVETKGPTGNFDNNAPAAKDAPAAPGPGDDVPKPGGGGKLKKR